MALCHDIWNDEPSTVASTRPIPRILRAFAGDRPDAARRRSAHGRSSSFKSNVNAQVAAARQVASEIGRTRASTWPAATPSTPTTPSTLRILASNTKLITSAAALDRLGPGYFFETDVLVGGTLIVRRCPDAATWRSSAVAIPNLSGRQYQGDSYGAFREWAAALKRVGVGRIARRPGAGPRASSTRSTCTRTGRKRPAHPLVRSTGGGAVVQRQLRAGQGCAVPSRRRSARVETVPPICRCSGSRARR